MERRFYFEAEPFSGPREEHWVETEKEAVSLFLALLRRRVSIKCIEADAHSPDELTP